ncbi:GspE/PulE family protein [Microbacterium sp.]|uniref:GspE/PulE family protein n=1 Tax=Microbacterium sp. TaxID=51671 RepID=UPI0028A8F8EA|nr:GspE/PulE family protein [Microbacterium sp.]
MLQEFAADERTTVAVPPATHALPGADDDVPESGTEPQPEPEPAPPVEPEQEAEPATPRERAVALAQRFGLAFVDLTEFAVELSVVTLIPDQLCRRHVALPISRIGERIMVAVADPANVIVLDDVAAVLQTPVIPVVAEAEAILAAIDRYHRVDSELEELTSAFEGGESDSDLWSQDVDAASDEAPIIRFVNLIISQAITDRASDIHIEPTRDELRVRYRIDGVLVAVQSVPRSMIAGVISRLKVMAELDIGERRRPQDGRITVVHSGRSVDLRVATLPTVWGEKVVARVLDAPVASLQLSDLSMLDRNMDVYRKSFTKPYGMILVTGPTGSGKSTTLYTTLAAISKPTVNVITVEDPVEYRMAGINQVQVNPRAGLTFASALRSILRSDPDVILLGEIRDEETAKIAIESSLTGHLVLSTLHTNDAPSSVTRLIEMGVEPFLVGSALDAVVAQRLARRLCARCKTESVATEVEMRMVGGLLDPRQEPPTVFRPAGCSQCSNTGYRGRVALHEVMAVDDEIERLASANAPTAQITAHAEAAGMTRLRMDGWAKVLVGHTSIEEVLRVTV